MAENRNLITTAYAETIFTALGNNPRTVLIGSNSGIPGYGTKTAPIKTIYVAGPNTNYAPRPVWPPGGTLVICQYQVIADCVAIIRLTCVECDDTSDTAIQNATEGEMIETIKDTPDGYHIDLSHMPAGGSIIFCRNIPQFTGSEAQTALANLQTYNSNFEKTFIATLVNPSDITIYTRHDEFTTPTIIPMWESTMNPLYVELTVSQNSGYTHGLVVAFPTNLLYSQTALSKTFVLSSQYKSSDYGYFKISNEYNKSVTFTNGTYITCCTRLNLKQVFVGSTSNQTTPQSLNNIYADSAIYTIAVSTDGTIFNYGVSEINGYGEIIQNGTAVKTGVLHAEIGDYFSQSDFSPKLD